MAFPAFLDTCTLYGYHLSDLVLRLAEAETFRPVWSDDVLEELRRNLIARAKLSEQQARRRITTMRTHFPDAEIGGYSALVDAMTCHPKDRHVLAAAVRADVSVLVTFDIGDFPRSSVEPYDIRVLHPDEFLLDQLDLHPKLTTDALHRQVASYVAPSLDMDELCARLARAGVPDFAASALRLVDP